MGSKGSGDDRELSGLQYPAPGEPESQADPVAVGRRIVQLRGKLRQEEFAAELGVHTNTLGRYERGERLPDAELLIALSKARGVSADWVLFGLPPMSLEEAASQPLRARALMGYHSEHLVEEIRATYLHSENVALVKLYDVEVGGGRGRVAPEQGRVKAIRNFERTWLHQELNATEDDVYLLTVRGDSMAPVLSDGDVILVDKRVHEVVQEDIYVVRIDDALYAKYGQRLPGGLVKFWSENEKISPPFTVNVHDQSVAPTFEVIGRACWRGGRIRR